MRRVDAAAFLFTALAVLTINAVAAIAIGCLLYSGSHVYSRLRVEPSLVRLQTE